LACRHGIARGIGTEQDRIDGTANARQEGKSACLAFETAGLCEAQGIVA
jgi:hypothetical protein